MQKRVTFEGSLEYDEENFDGELTDKQAAEIAQNTVAENPQIVGFDIETVEEDDSEPAADQRVPFMISEPNVHDVVDTLDRAGYEVEEADQGFNVEWSEGE